MRLLPEVIFNGLASRSFLHGDVAATPSWESVKATCNGERVARFVETAGEELTSALAQAVEGLAKGNDINNNRVNAMSDAHAAEAQGGGSGGGSGGGGGGQQPEMVCSYYGVFRPATAGVKDYLDGIAMISTEDGDGDDGGGGGVDGGAGDGVGGGDGYGDGGGGPANSVAGPAAAPPPLQARRASDPEDDYANAARQMYGAWMMLLPLRSGLQLGKSISKQQMRRLLLYGDCRFAQTIALVFHLCNMQMRHEVNKTVKARVVSTPAAFEAFRELVCDLDFRALLERAREDPQGPEATQVLRKVLPFITLCASKVAWSGASRAAEMTKHMAIARYFDHGSHFTSVALDDVHDELTARFAHPTTSTEHFPWKPSAEFQAALRSGSEGRVRAVPQQMSEGWRQPIGGCVARSALTLSKSLTMLLTLAPSTFTHLNFYPLPPQQHSPGFNQPPLHVEHLPLTLTLAPTLMNPYPRPHSGEASPSLSPSV